MSEAVDPLALAVGVALVAGLGTLGWRGWKALAPGLEDHGLAWRETSLHGLWLFGLGWFLMLAVAVSLVWVTGSPEDVPLVTLLGQQMLSTGLAAAAILMLARSLPGGAGALGWRAHRGPSAWLVGGCGWLLFLPVMALAMPANLWLLQALDIPIDLQLLLSKFLDEPQARTSPWVWLGAVVVIPVGEEVLYRGALFGGLRAVAPAPVAIALSAIAFGAGHPPVAMLPTALLGVLLALIYERTGSLAAPCVLHGLHNGVTLALATTL